VLGQAAIASLRIKSKQEFEAIGGDELPGAHYGQLKHLALNSQDVECSPPTPAPGVAATPSPTTQQGGACVNLVFLVHTNPSSAPTDTDMIRKGYYAKVQVLTPPTGGQVQIRFDTYTADGSKTFSGQAKLFGNPLPLSPNNPGHVTIGLIPNTDLSFVNGQTSAATPTPTPTTAP
jgi:hypothetical protein